MAIMIKLKQWIFSNYDIRETRKEKLFVVFKGASDDVSPDNDSVEDFRKRLIEEVIFKTQNNKSYLYSKTERVLAALMVLYFTNRLNTDFLNNTETLLAQGIEQIKKNSLATERYVLDILRGNGTSVILAKESRAIEDNKYLQKDAAEDCAKIRNDLLGELDNQLFLSGKALQVQVQKLSAGSGIVEASESEAAEVLEVIAWDKLLQKMNEKISLVIAAIPNAEPRALVGNGSVVTGSPQKSSSPAASVDNNNNNRDDTHSVVPDSQLLVSKQANLAPVVNTTTIAIAVLDHAITLVKTIVGTDKTYTPQNKMGVTFPTPQVATGWIKSSSLQSKANTLLDPSQVSNDPTVIAWQKYLKLVGYKEGTNTSDGRINLILNKAQTLSTADKTFETIGSLIIAAMQLEQAKSDLESQLQHGKGVLQEAHTALGQYVQAHYAAILKDISHILLNALGAYPYLEWDLQKIKPLIQLSEQGDERVRAVEAIQAFYKQVKTTGCEFSVTNPGERAPQEMLQLIRKQGKDTDDFYIVDAYKLIDGNYKKDEKSQKIDYKINAKNYRLDINPDHRVKSLLGLAKWAVANEGAEGQEGAVRNVVKYLIQIKFYKSNEGLAFLNANEILAEKANVAKRRRAIVSSQIQQVAHQEFRKGLAAIDNNNVCEEVRNTLVNVSVCDTELQPESLQEAYVSYAAQMRQQLNHSRQSYIDLEQAHQRLTSSNSQAPEKSAVTIFWDHFISSKYHKHAAQESLHQQIKVRTADPWVQAYNAFNLKVDQLEQAITSNNSFNERRDTNETNGYKAWKNSKWFWETKFTSAAKNIAAFMGENMALSHYQAWRKANGPWWWLTAEIKIVQQYKQSDAYKKWHLDQLKLKSKVVQDKLDSVVEDLIQDAPDLNTLRVQINEFKSLCEADFANQDEIKPDLSNKAIKDFNDRLTTDETAGYQAWKDSKWFWETKFTSASKNIAAFMGENMELSHYEVWRKDNGPWFWWTPEVTIVQQYKKSAEYQQWHTTRLTLKSPVVNKKSMDVLAKETLDKKSLVRLQAGNWKMQRFLSANSEKDAPDFYKRDMSGFKSGVPILDELAALVLEKNIKFAQAYIKENEEQLAADFSGLSIEQKALFLHVLEVSVLSNIVTNSPLAVLHQIELLKLLGNNWHKQMLDLEKLNSTKESLNKLIKTVPQAETPLDELFKLTADLQKLIHEVVNSDDDECYARIKAIALKLTLCPDIKLDALATQTDRLKFILTPEEYAFVEKNTKNLNFAAILLLEMQIALAYQQSGYDPNVTRIANYILAAGEKIAKLNIDRNFRGAINDVIGKIIVIRDAYNDELVKDGSTAKLTEAASSLLAADTSPASSSSSSSSSSTSPVTRAFALSLQPVVEHKQALDTAIGARFTASV
jgi:hypothetical protein